MKTLILISFFVFSAYAIAHGPEAECRQIDFAERLTNFVSQKQCPTNDEAILKRVEAEYNSFYRNLPKTKKVVKGLRLEGSRKELDLMIEMMGEKPHSSWPAIAQGCLDVLCAMEKLVGSREAAMQLFNIPAKSNYILSLDQKINNNMAEQMWSPAEIREIDATMAKLPQDMRQLTLRKIERLANNLRKHGHSGNVAAYASPKNTWFDADLVVYDSGMHGLTSGKDPYARTSWPQEVIVHELCHHHDYKGYYATKGNKYSSQQLKGEWLKISGWKEETGPDGKPKWKQAENGQFVSSYAGSSPTEDYAESCMNYLLNPQELKDKAPAKYDYMKRHVYNNQEFLTKPWTTGAVPEWPALANMVKDQSQCNAKIAACIQDARFYDFYPIEQQLDDNACIKKMRNDLGANINIALAEDPQYCDAGGANAVSAQAEKLCAEPLSLFAKAMTTGKKTNFANAIKTCETNRDFSEECVFKTANFAPNLPEEFVPAAIKHLSSAVPNRMAALGNSALPSAGWITSCLKLAKNIEVQNVLVNGKPDVFYGWTDQKGKETYLGKYLSLDFPRDDMNSSCAAEAVKSFQAQGIKTPKSGHPIQIFQAPFKQELDSFQKEILGNLKNAQKGCLMSNSCKERKILELLMSWESKDPERRAGISTEGLAKELREKVKTF